jgi:hypothetical protein
MLCNPARTSLLRPTALIIAMLASISPGTVSAQSAGEAQSPAQQGVTCPPDVKTEPPTVGSGGSEQLSDKLARLKGVICPPAGIDRDMPVAPPGGGELKVIPPPGSPGGDQRVQPK